MSTVAALDPSPDQTRLCPACCEALRQLTDGLLAAAWRPSDPGEADAERYSAMRGHAASIVALALQTDDPETATRFAIGHLRQHFVNVFDLLYGSKRAPAVLPPESVALPRSGGGEKC